MWYYIVNKKCRGVFVRLRLDLCDVDMQLKIWNWKDFNSDEAWYDSWTDSELSLHSTYLNYDREGELFMCDEVSDLRSAMDQLLSGKMEKDCSMEFAEPDIEFAFRAAKRLYSMPGKVIYPNGYEDVDIYVDMIINFWCKNGLGSNAFSMVLDRQKIEAFCVYLKIVVGELTEDAPIVKELMQKGMLLPE